MSDGASIGAVGQADTVAGVLPEVRPSGAEERADAASAPGDVPGGPPGLTALANPLLQVPMGEDGQPLESPLADGQARNPALIVKYVRGVRRRKGTPEEKHAEKFLRRAVRAAFGEWQKRQPKEGNEMKKPIRQLEHENRVLREAIQAAMALLKANKNSARRFAHNALAKGLVAARAPEPQPVAPKILDPIPPSGYVVAEPEEHEDGSGI